MRALIRKECGELLAIVAVAFPLLCLLLFGSRSNSTTLIVPDNFLALSLFTIAAIAGVVLGYFQFASERWMGRTAYLLHRGKGRSSVFFAKAITGLGATLLLSIGTLGVFAFARRYLSANGPLVRFDRVVEPACATAFGFVAYGLGALAAQVRRHPIAEILLVACGSFGAVLFADVVLDSLPAKVTAALALFVVSQMAMGAILLLLARRLFLDDVDRELAHPRGPSGALALLALPMLVAPVVSIASRLEGTLLEMARRSDPMLLRDESNRTIFAVRPDRRDEFVRLDYRGEVDTSAPPLHSREVGDSYETLYSRLETWRFRPWLRFPEAAWVSVRDAYFRYRTQGGAPHEIVAPESGNPRVFLDRTDHVIRVYGLVESGWPLTERPVRNTPFEFALGKPPTGSPFSDDVQVLLGVARERPAGFDDLGLDLDRVRNANRMHPCIVDAADGSFWRLDAEASPPALLPVMLPGGDRFASVEMLFEHLSGGFRRWNDSRLDAVVHGEKGTYAWDGETFQEWQPSARCALRADVESRVGAQAVFATTDPLATRVEIRGIGDERVLFDWTYGPRNSAERFWAILAQGCTLLRPPLANLIASARPASTDAPSLWYPDWLFDPLLAEGERPALLAVSLALGLVSAVWTARRMHHRGMAVPLIMLWSAIVFVLGPIAHVFARAFEVRPVAETAIHARAAVRRELLIESA